MIGLTDRQRQVLDIICRWNREHGYPPSFREIAAELGVRSTNSVNGHLRALERKGFLVSLPNNIHRSRILRPAALPDPEDERYVRVPMWLYHELIAIRSREQGAQ